jgi:heme/copper-type cytochrome/quinol oxidase subunit 2
MFGLLYITNPKWPQMDETTVFLMTILWYVAILFGVVTLVVLLIRRRMKNGGRREKKANRKARPVDGRS